MAKRHVQTALLTFGYGKQIDQRRYSRKKGFNKQVAYKVCKCTAASAMQIIHGSRSVEGFPEICEVQTKSLELSRRLSAKPLSHSGEDDEETGKDLDPPTRFHLLASMTLEGQHAQTNPTTNALAPMTAKANASEVRSHDDSGFSKGQNKDSVVHCLALKMRSTLLHTGAQRFHPVVVPTAPLQLADNAHAHKRTIPGNSPRVVAPIPQLQA
eukprot:548964-Amphidinium_carterae.1